MSTLRDRAAQALQVRREEELREQEAAEQQRLRHSLPRLRKALTNWGIPAARVETNPVEIDGVWFEMWQRRDQEYGSIGWELWTLLPCRGCGRLLRAENVPYLADLGAFLAKGLAHHPRPCWECGAREPQPADPADPDPAAQVEESVRAFLAAFQRFLTTSTDPTESRKEGSGER